MRRDHELHGRRRGRNLAVFGALLALVALLFAVTIVKLGDEAGNPTGGASWGESLVRWLTDRPAGAPQGAAAANPAVDPATGEPQQ